MTQSTSTAPRRRRPKKKIPGWQRFLLYWRLPMIIVLVLLVVVGVAVGVIFHKRAPKPVEVEPLTTAQLFDAAVLDAVQADADEIKALVTLTAEDPLCTIDENGLVTLVVWHNTPDTYVKDQNIELQGNDVWAFTDKEIQSWGKTNKKQLTSETGILRLEQLLGLPGNTGNTHFSLLKVEATRVIRPAYQTDPTKNEMATTFVTAPDETYQSWFNSTILSSYFGTKDLPWTRLGYTYDWAEGSEGYGVTQFVIPGTSKVSVAETFTNEEFRTLLSKGRDLITTT